jgi:hypothetical protein
MSGGSTCRPILSTNPTSRSFTVLPRPRGPAAPRPRGPAAPRIVDVPAMTFLMIDGHG